MCSPRKDRERRRTKDDMRKFDYNVEMADRDEAIINGGLPEALANLRFEVRLRVAEREEAVIEAAKRMARDLEGIVRSVENGRMLNTLGELQSRGPQFDILCATCQDARDHLVAVEATCIKIMQGLGAP